MLELWHEWNSVHSFKVRVALAEKDLSWADRRVDLLRLEHLQPAYLKLNPDGVVPTLVHEGQVVLGSSVICQYLDDAFPVPALLPPAPLLRARCRSWLKYFDDHVHPPIRRASFELLYRPRLAATKARSEFLERLRSHPDRRRAEAFAKAIERGEDPQAVAESVKAFEAIISKIETALEQDWLSGPAFGMADVAMAPFVERLDSLSLNRLWSLPRGLAWTRRLMQRSAVQLSRAPSAYRLSC